MATPASRVYDDLQYGAFALGDIGPEVRDEFVRKPWLTERERMEFIGTLAMSGADIEEQNIFHFGEGEKEGDAKGYARARAEALTTVEKIDEALTALGKVVETALQEVG